MILVGVAIVSATLAALIPRMTRLRSRFRSETSASPESVSAAPLQADRSSANREASDADLLRVALAAFSVHRMHRASTLTPPRSSGWARPRRMRQSAPFQKRALVHRRVVADTHRVER
jgi:hypothetical protein